MNRISLTRLVCVTAATALLGLGIGATPSPAKPTQGHHCVGTANKVVDGVEVQAKPSRPDACFGSLSEAIAYATGGGLVLPSAVTFDEAVAAIAAYQLVAAPTETIVGVDQDYDWINETYTHRVEDDDGCADGETFQRPSMSNGWNDKVDSAETFAGCSATYYEHEDYKGSSISCTCASMGAMEDETSSIKWYRASAGSSASVAARGLTPGQF